MRMEIYKLGQGFLPSGEDAEKVHRRMDPGELIWVEICRIRDIVMHRRYWKLMTLCADNCERIVCDDGAVIPIRDKDDMHVAMKLLTGHCEYVFDAVSGRPLLAIPMRTNFEELDADQWLEYWQKVTVAVTTKVLPGVRGEFPGLEILRCAGLAS